MSTTLSAVAWLQENKYDAVVEEIHAIEALWKSQGKATRRDWWSILAGNRDGSARVVAGRTFPIVASVREREGLPPVKGAVRKRKETVPPPKAQQKRWANRQSTDSSP